jgi:hypothetical protein
MELQDPMYRIAIQDSKVAAVFVYDSLGGKWWLPGGKLREIRAPMLEIPPAVFQRRAGKTP